MCKRLRSLGCVRGGKVGMWGFYLCPLDWMLPAHLHLSLFCFSTIPFHAFFFPHKAFASWHTPHRYSGLSMTRLLLLFPLFRSASMSFLQQRNHTKIPPFTTCGNARQFFLHSSIKAHCKRKDVKGVVFSRIEQKREFKTASSQIRLCALGIEI